MPIHTKLRPDLKLTTPPIISCAKTNLRRLTTDSSYYPTNLRLVNRLNRKIHKFPDLPMHEIKMSSDLIWLLKKHP